MAPWWRDLGRLDDDLADCAAKYDALSSEALRDADAARNCTRPNDARNKRKRSSRAARSPELGSWRAHQRRRPSGSSSGRRPMQSMQRASRASAATTCTRRRRPRPRSRAPLYAYCAAARAFDGFHLDEGAAADAWLAACPAVARDERPETVAAALINAERQAIAAGLASKGGHAALARDAAAILGAGPRAVAAALLDAWACVARHRARAEARPAEGALPGVLVRARPSRRRRWPTRAGVPGRAW